MDVFQQIVDCLLPLIVVVSTGHQWPVKAQVIKNKCNIILNFDDKYVSNLYLKMDLWCYWSWINLTIFNVAAFILFKIRPRRDWCCFLVYKMLLMLFVGFFIILFLITVCKSIWVESLVERFAYGIVHTVQYHQLHCFTTLLVLSYIGHHSEFKSKSFITLLIALYSIFADACLLEIITMHKNVAVISIHDDKSIIFSIIKEFQSSCVP